MDFIFHHIYLGKYISLIICTDLSGNEPQSPVELDCTGIVGGLVGGTLASNERGIGLNHALGTILPMFITPTTLVVVFTILVKSMSCIVVETPLCVYM